MKQYKGYFLDIDGTLIRGDQVIPGAKQFLHFLQEQNIPFLYLTNNSTRTPLQVKQMLAGFSLPVELQQIYTASMAVSQFLQSQQQISRAYVVGEEGLLTAVENAGCMLTAENPDVVVVGRDEQFTYEKMSYACMAISQGAKLIGTSADRAYPTTKGFLPGSGALIKGIEAATGVKAIYIGKPERMMMEYALAYSQLKKEDVLMVGDNLETDIQAGHNIGMDTCLVFTGVTTTEEAKQSPFKATYETESLAAFF